MITLAFDLTDRLCVVVGGGEAAEQKVRALLRAGARVRVVSPSLSPWLVARLASGAIEHWSRPYQPGDLEGAALVVSATGRPEVDRAVATEAKAARQLLSVSGEPALGDVHFLAELHRGPVTIAVATGGGSPALAVRIRDEIGQAIGPEYGALAELLAAARRRLKAAGRLTQRERAALLRQIVYGPALAMLRGETEAARRLVDGIIAAEGPNEGESGQSGQRDE